MKKIIAMVLALVLVAGLSIAGTLAYLQDDDYNVNTMTMYDVHIDQMEYECVRDESGNVTSMNEYTNAKPLYPAVAKNGFNDISAWQPAGNDGIIYYANYLGDDYCGGNGLWENLNNVQDKFVFVKNTGTTDAYYRTIILLEADATNTYNSDGKAMIHLNVNGHDNFDWGTNSKGKKDTDITAETMRVTVNGEEYYVKVALYKEVLEPEEISRPSLLQVGMDQLATNEIVAQFGETYDIVVLSQAVQAAGFDDAKTALNTAFGEVTEENVLTWFADIAPAGSNGNLQ